jgi:hypothetical protein
MRASFRLDFEDNLSRGLANLKNGLSALRDVGRSLGLGKLERDDALRRLSSEAQNLVGHLRAIVTSADGASAAVSRMWARASKWGHKTFGAQSHIGALGAAAEGYSLFAPTEAYAGFNSQLRQIAIAKGLSGAAANAEISRLTKFVDKEALAGGQTSASVEAAYYGLQTGGAGTEKQVEEALSAHTRAATAYGIDPEAFTPVTLALMKNFHVFGEDLKRTLAAVGQAAKEGQMKVTDFANVLPQVAGQMNTHGMTGRQNANLSIAALQTIRTDVGEAGQAGTDFNYMLDTMYSKTGMQGFALTGRNTFAEQRARALMMKATGGYGGIDVSALIDNAAKQGIGPIDAVLGKLMEIKSKLNPHEFSNLLGAMFTNDEARKGWQALINHFDQFKAMRGQLNAVDASKVNTDFATAFADPEVKLRIMHERLVQLTRTVGAGFFPVFLALNGALSRFMELIDWMDAKMPGAKESVLLVVGGFLAFGAAIAAIGVVGPPFIAGLSLMGGALDLVWTALTFGVGVIEGILPAIGVVLEVLGGLIGVGTAVAGAIVVAVIAVAAAAYDIIANWSRFRGFFVEMWQGVEDLFMGFVEFLGGLFLGDMSMAGAGIVRIWTGVKELLGGIWGTLKQLFIDFITTIDGWTGGAIIGAFKAIAGAVGGVIDKIHEWIDLLKNSAVGHMLGFDTGTAAPNKPAALTDEAGHAMLPAPGAVNGNVKVTVGVDDNGRLVIKNAASDSKAVHVGTESIDVGQTLGRD